MRGRCSSRPAPRSRPRRRLGEEHRRSTGQQEQRSDGRSRHGERRCRQGSGASAEPGHRWRPVGTRPTHQDRRDHSGKQRPATASRPPGDARPPGEAQRRRAGPAEQSGAGQRPRRTSRAPRRHRRDARPGHGRRAGPSAARRERRRGHEPPYRRAPVATPVSALWDTSGPGRYRVLARPVSAATRARDVPAVSSRPRAETPPAASHGPSRAGQRCCPVREKECL